MLSEVITRPGQLWCTMPLTIDPHRAEFQYIEGFSTQADAFLAEQYGSVMLPTQLDIHKHKHWGQEHQSQK